MKALIVDDSRVVRTVSSKILTDLNISYDQAENGAIALEKVKSEQFSFILLDWNMPEMDGMEFFMAAKKAGLLKKTKVIFCTTESDMDRITKAISEGANEYIMKPYSKEIVQDKLQMLGLI